MKEEIITYEFIPCPNCDGEGGHEVLNCHRPASSCCGGCYESQVCQECNGSGEVKNPKHNE